MAALTVAVLAVAGGVVGIDRLARLLDRNLELERGHAILAYQLESERQCGPRSFCMLRRIEMEETVSERVAEIRAQHAVLARQIREDEARRRAELERDLERFRRAAEARRTAAEPNPERRIRG